MGKKLTTERLKSVDTHGHLYTMMLHVLFQCLCEGLSVSRSTAVRVWTCLRQKTLSGWNSWRCCGEGCSEVAGTDRKGKTLGFFFTLVYELFLMEVHFLSQRGDPRWSRKFTHLNPYMMIVDKT